jgi:nicotinamide phosphoribosyltransferase
MVSDSYDYWHLVHSILPQCKEEILAHNGFIAIRGDSGNPVEVVTKTVFALWSIFGGTINSKGYKVLDPHVKAIYGDSITPQRCEAIYEILEKNGYSIENVSLGVGSFSFMCHETQNDFYTWDANGDAATVKMMNYAPYTRDTFGIAIKATYGETATYDPVMIFKNPKALAWKKSQKGCVWVAPDGQSYTDEHTFAEAHAYGNGNLLQPVFLNGKMLKEFTLDEVRKNMYPEGF